MGRGRVSGMRPAFLSLVFGAGLLTGQTADAPPTWKDFSIVPAGKLDKPLEKTVEWTFAEAGSKVVYPACCPW